jgi:hypothetical protein
MVLWVNRVLWGLATINAIMGLLLAISGNDGWWVNSILSLFSVVAAMTPPNRVR